MCLIFSKFATKLGMINKGLGKLVLRKMLVAFMSLAFFYLVIGDLIVFHQKAIFNFDAFAGQPLNKPGDKSDKSTLYKLKDKKNRIIASALTFVSEHNEFSLSPVLNSYEILEVPTNCPLALDDIEYELSLRGPPSL